MATLTPEASRDVNEAMGLPAEGPVTVDAEPLPPGGPRDGDYPLRFTTAGGDLVVWVPMRRFEDVDFDLWAWVLEHVRAGKVRVG